jgi:hypothetical protein
MSMLLARAARPAVLHAARGRAAALTGRASLYAAAGARNRPRAAVASEIARMAPSWLQTRRQGRRTCPFYHRASTVDAWYMCISFFFFLHSKKVEKKKKSHGLNDRR